MVVKFSVYLNRHVFVMANGEILYLGFRNSDIEILVVSIARTWSSIKKITLIGQDVITATADDIIYLFIYFHM